MKNFLLKIVFFLLSLIFPILSYSNVSIPAGDCSGVIFKMPNMTDNQKALVLTNGHCIGLGRFNNRYPDDGEIFINFRLKRLQVVYPRKHKPWLNEDYFVYQRFYLQR